MEDLLFYTLIIAGSYYLLVYLPQQKPIVTNNQSTQTETLTNADENHLESTLDTLIKNIQQLNNQLC